MLQARDIMTEGVICVSEGTSVIEAIRLMAARNVTGIPVVGDDMTLIGILSEQDVMRLLHTFDQEKDRTVNELMTQPAIHFEEEACVVDICHFLKDHSIRRVPITRNGKVVGVISRSDIIKCIVQRSESGCVQTA